MKHRFSIPLLALALFAIGAVPLALADAQQAAPLQQPEAGLATVFSYGKENPDCLEWTNACQTCKRDEAGAPACSTPGIACTPGALVCRTTRPK